MHVGTELARREITVDRARLVRYANASGDLNPIHQDDEVARSVGLPGVIAHGMWTMGAVVDVVVDALGDPGAILDYQARFSRLVPVPESGEARLLVVATIGAVDQTARTARVDLQVTLDEQRVLGKAQVVVRT